jgi:hypothetical protein
MLTRRCRVRPPFTGHDEQLCSCIPVEGRALECGDGALIGLVGVGVVTSELQEHLVDGRVRLEGVLINNIKHDTHEVNRRDGSNHPHCLYNTLQITTTMSLNKLPESARDLPACD